MPPKGKDAIRKSPVPKRQVNKEETVRKQEREVEPVDEEEEEEEEAEGDFDTAITSTGKQNKESYYFPPSCEETLAKFYKKNDCFYNKASPLFLNKEHKKNLIEDKAQKLGTTSNKIEGWFRSRRKAVTYLYKNKLDQAPEKLTDRRSWHLQKFGFLKQHIAFRSNKEDTGSLPCRESKSEDSEETEVEVEAEQNRASSRGTRSQKVDDDLSDNMSRLDVSEAPLKQIQQEKIVLSEMFSVRINNVPEVKWVAFQTAVLALLEAFTQGAEQATQPPTQPVSVSQQGSPRTPQWQLQQ